MQMKLMIFGLVVIGIRGFQISGEPRDDSDRAWRENTGVPRYRQPPLFVRAPDHSLRHIRFELGAAKAGRGPIVCENTCRAITYILMYIYIYVYVLYILCIYIIIL